MSASERPAALITAATSTLGAVLARSFAGRGYFVGIHYHSREERAAELLEEVKRLGGDGRTLAADLSSVSGAERAVERFLEVSPRLDVLVNNAGGNRDRLLHFTAEPDWRETLALNLDSVYGVTRRAVMAMVRERRGSIVTISSISGIAGVAGQTAYAAAKSGVHGFTRALAREVGRFNVRVNAIAPGAIESPAIDALSPEQRQWMEDASCLKRIGQPREVAALALFLASDEASFITGQIIAVDGGIT